MTTAPLILALFLGFTSAHTITGWTSPKDAETGIRHNILDIPDIADVNWFAEFDLGYQTHYTGHAPDTLALGVQGESYGINFYSYALLDIEGTFLNYYSKSSRMYFEPLMIAPFTQTIYWTKPESGMGTHLFLAGSRTVRLGEYATIITENTQIGKKSIHQIVEKHERPIWSHEEMFYEDDFKNKYVDPYSSGNLFFKISPDFYFRMIKTPLFGYHEWYNIQLF
eukprot:403345197